MNSLERKIKLYRCIQFVQAQFIFCFYWASPLYNLYFYTTRTGEFCCSRKKSREDSKSIFLFFFRLIKISKYPAPKFLVGFAINTYSNRIIWFDNDSFEEVNAWCLDMLMATIIPVSNNSLPLISVAHQNEAYIINLTLI